MEQRLPLAFLLLLMNCHTQVLLLVSKYLLSPSSPPGAILGTPNSVWNEKAMFPALRV